MITPAHSRVRDLHRTAATLVVVLVVLCGCGSPASDAPVREPKPQSSAPTSAPTNGVSAIRGFVRFVDGTPLPYANVIITGTKFGGITHKDGSFTISGIPVGQARLRVTHGAYRGEKIELVTLAAGKTTELTIVLNPREFVRDERIYFDPDDD